MSGHCLPPADATSSSATSLPVIGAPSTAKGGAIAGLRDAAAGAGDPGSATRSATGQATAQKTTRAPAKGSRTPLRPHLPRARQRRPETDSIDGALRL
jgi:hypothetical protein